MKRLQAAGKGTMQKKAEIISYEDEEILWEKGILGNGNLQSLLDTMLFINGLYFAWRGGKEHRQLRHHRFQIQLVEKPGETAYLVHKEDISKNHQGGLKNGKIKPKIAMHHANIENPRRCFVRLYKLYNSLCPPNRPNNTLNLQPLQKPIKDLWYSTKPVGHLTLEKTVNRMCREVGISGYYTNHYLRATAATRLHQSGVEEQEIMERTGHRSTEAIRSYKRTSIINKKRYLIF